MGYQGKKSLWKRHNKYNDRSNYKVGVKMKKVTNLIRNNVKVVIAFILGGIILGTCGAYASSVISASDVSYSNTSSGISSTNVQDAIEELYDKTFVKQKIKAYTYSETGNNKCINGEEKTCVETTCYKTKTANSCIQGTIIKYYVNDTEQKVFYVLHDDGSTITMQQRENTVRNIPWYKDADDSTKGPQTILPYLEAATATWTNVEFQEYTAGYTNFYQNAYTGCTYSTSDYKITCNVNTYNGDQENLTLSKRKVRARMITAQEASSTGCLVWKDGSKDSTIMGNSINAWNNGSCPDWMHNYLYQSKTYGGSYEDNTLNENGIYNYDYWTMSANSSYSPNAWYVSREGYLGSGNTSSTGNGARAVVVISK